MVDTLDPFYCFFFTGSLKLNNSRIWINKISLIHLYNVRICENGVLHLQGGAVQLVTKPEFWNFEEWISYHPAPVSNFQFLYYTNLHLIEVQIWMQACIKPPFCETSLTSHNSNLLHPPAVSKLGAVCITTLDNNRSNLDEKVRPRDANIFST